MTTDEQIERLRRQARYWRWAPAVIIPLFTLVFLAAIYLTPPLKDKWDRATLLRICRDGTPILRLQDGTVWARRSAVTAYRVENEDKVC